MYRKIYIYHCPIECEFKRLFGEYPNEYFTNLRKTNDYDTSRAMFQPLIDKAWHSSKLRHEEEIKADCEREQRLLREECPF